MWGNAADVPGAGPRHRDRRRRQRDRRAHESLWIFAAVTALAGLVAIGIVLTRDIANVTVDQSTLRSLGATRAQRIAGRRLARGRDRHRRRGHRRARRSPRCRRCSRSGSRAGPIPTSASTRTSVRARRHRARRRGRARHRIPRRVARDRAAWSADRVARARAAHVADRRARGTRRAATRPRPTACAWRSQPGPGDRGTGAFRVRGRRVRHRGHRRGARVRREPVASRRDAEARGLDMGPEDRGAHRPARCAPTPNDFGLAHTRGSRPSPRCCTKSVEVDGRAGHRRGASGSSAATITPTVVSGRRSAERPARSRWARSRCARSASTSATRSRSPTSSKRHDYKIVGQVALPTIGDPQPLADGALMTDAGIAAIVQAGANETHYLLVALAPGREPRAASTAGSRRSTRSRLRHRRAPPARRQRTRPLPWRSTRLQQIDWFPIIARRACSRHWRCSRSGTRSSRRSAAGGASSRCSRRSASAAGSSAHGRVAGDDVGGRRARDRDSDRAARRQRGVARRSPTGSASRSASTIPVARGRRHRGRPRSVLANLIAFFPARAAARTPRRGGAARRVADQRRAAPKSWLDPVLAVAQAGRAHEHAAAGVLDVLVERVVVAERALQRDELLGRLHVGREEQPAEQRAAHRDRCRRCRSSRAGGCAGRRCARGSRAGCARRRGSRARRRRRARRSRGCRTRRGR